MGKSKKRRQQTNSEHDDTDIDDCSVNSFNEIMKDAKIVMSNSSQNDKVDEISNKLDKIINLLTKIESHLSHSHQDRVPANVIPAPQRPNKIDVHKKLSLVKKERKISYFRALKNLEQAKIYETALDLPEPKVPHKLHEKILNHDSHEIIELKKERSISNTKYEIKKLKYHGNLHSNKTKLFDENANKLMDMLNDTDKETAKREWDQYLIREEGISKSIWKKKSSFLESDSHLTKVGFAKSNYDSPSYKSSYRQSYSDVVKLNSPHNDSFRPRFYQRPKLKYF